MKNKTTLKGLQFKSLCIYSKEKCPMFTGVKEHGTKAVFSFDEYCYTSLAEKYEINQFEDATLQVFEDGHISIMAMKYNYRFEEWEEKEVCVFENQEKSELIKDLDFMLRYNSGAKTANGLIVINCFVNLVEALKLNKNLIMF